MDCASCHVVPAAIVAPAHLDGIVQVAFAGHAVDRGASPVWDGHACSSVACHGAALVDPPAVAPVWSDPTGRASACGACHGIPPTQHSPSTSCDRSTCHGSEVSRSWQGILGITPSGKALHIDGMIEVQ
jgi:predicted CxxxxCH...CXXCH cytochrome family protein